MQKSQPIFTFCIKIFSSKSGILMVLLTLLLMTSCDKDPNELGADNLTPPDIGTDIVENLEAEYDPLPANPLNWGNSDLSFLDEVAGKQVIGLGEATHGTAEFFDSKFRIFRYLVENHDFKIFAIEADFGESILINDAIQRSATNEIADLMKSKMIFWTWRTEEVQAMLEWMSEYNVGKADEEKVQYFGVDAQFNLHNPDILKDYLQQTNAPFFSYANTVLNEAKNASDTSFDSYDEAAYDLLLEKLDGMRDSIQKHEAFLIAESSQKAFELNLHLANVIKQASQVQYSSSNYDFSSSERDKFMAENTIWLREYFNDAPVVVWAHNGHVAKDPTFVGVGGAMGRHLQRQIGSGYSSLGFLFARGSFTAVTVVGDQYGGLERQTISVAPKSNSLNAIFSRASDDVFSIELSRLNQYEDWQEVYANSIQYFHIGAVFNNNPEDYYLTFNPVYYDRLIYFEQSTATVLLPSN